MQSPSSSSLRAAALLVAAVIPTISLAASETFLNGQSIYGQPGAVSGASRVVDVAQATRLNVAYGETVVFRGDAGQQFAWTFNGLDRRAVEETRVLRPGSQAAPAAAHRAYRSGERLADAQDVPRVALDIDLLFHVAPGEAAHGGSGERRDCPGCLDDDRQLRRLVTDHGLSVPEPHGERNVACLEAALETA